MIVLFTDFGWQGPYVGQMKAVLQRRAPGVAVLDLMHDAPRFNPRAAAWLLAALAWDFPAETIFVAVVDPGVGSASRRPAMLHADGRRFVGPDNGLFDVVRQRAMQHDTRIIDWRPESLSASFHGRDLFAPVAAMLATGTKPACSVSPVPANLPAWSEQLAEVIYLDHFGNAMLGVWGEHCDETMSLQIGEERLPYRRTFAEAEPDCPFWYTNSSGLVEIALNQGSAEARLQLALGSSVQRLPC